MNEISGLKGQWMFPMSTDLQPMKRSDEISGGMAPPPTSKSQSSSSFIDTLKDALKEVNEVQLKMDKSMQDMSTGKSTSLHDVMIAMEKADVTLKTAAAVRNKMVEAYNEVMRMQI